MSRLRLRAAPRLRMYLRGLQAQRRAQAERAAARARLPENPYRRCFTRDRSFEELAAARRQQSLCGQPVPENGAEDAEAPARG